VDPGLSVPNCQAFTQVLVNQRCGSALVSMRNRKTHFMSMRILFWIQEFDKIQGFDNQKLHKNVQLKKSKFFDKKLQFTYPSVCRNKGRSSYRRSLQPSKENIQHFKS
jgi:hypothetical protein